MASIHVESEREADRAWTFRVAVDRDGEPRTWHEVSLSWVDYDFWSGGRRPPEEVASAVVRAILSASAPPRIPERFDASTARRWVEDLDRVVRESL